jgi:hypothetical protein
VGGNTALALLLTVGTNLAGIFTMPFVLAAVLGGGGGGGVAIAPRPLLAALVQTILAPLLAGAAARAFIPGVRFIWCRGTHVRCAARVGRILVCTDVLELCRCMHARLVIATSKAPTACWRCVQAWRGPLMRGGRSWRCSARACWPWYRGCRWGSDLLSEHCITCSTSDVNGALWASQACPAVTSQMAGE